MDIDNDNDNDNDTDDTDNDFDTQMAKAQSLSLLEEKKRKIRNHKENKVLNTLIKKTQENKGENMDNSIEKNGNGKDKNNENKDKNDKNDKKEENKEKESHWWDFNDLDVRSIRKNELKDTFKGGEDECVYMLFYRRKNLGKYQEWPPKIPE